MNLYEEFFQVVKAFNGKRIRYALVGGLSMAFHDRRNPTQDQADIEALRDDKD